MPKKVWTPLNSDAEAAKCAIGSAIVVPRGGLIDGKHQRLEYAAALAVHAAVVDKLAYATPFNPCSLRWLLSGTTPTTLAHLLTTQPTPTAKCGGIMTGAAAFKPELPIRPMCANNFLVPRKLHGAKAM